MPRDDLSAEAGTGRARLAVIRATRPGRITKRFERGTNGELVKFPGGPLVEGRAEIRTVDGLGDLTKLLLSLGPDEALTFGVPVGGDGVLVTRRTFERQGRPAGTIPRTRDQFGWPSGPGILMLDHDPAPGEAAVGREALVAALRDAAPGLARVAMLWWPSASSHVRDTATGADLTGLRGQRIYILVRDARDIPRAGAALVERLWAAGHGRILVSASGAALDRTLVDASVWQPERLDFAAGADCGPGLRQDRGRPVQIEGTTEWTDTRTALPDDDAIRRAADRARDAARAAMRDRIEAARSAWIEERVAAMQMREAERGLGSEIPSRDQMRAVARRAVRDGILVGPFPVEVEVAPGAFETRTVADLLAAPDRYDGRLTRDPLEPAYDGGRPVGRLFLVGGQPNLWSFAHGGHNFRLRRIAERIEVVTGRLVEATDATVDVLRAGTDTFVHAERMVLVQGGRILPFDEPALAHHIAGLVQFWRQPSGERGRAGPVEIDPPPELVRQVLSIGTGVGLKPLAGIVTAPTLRPDGSVLSLPGYDATTGPFLDANGQDLPMIEDHPERSSVELALATLMTPFTDFPLVGAEARGALLAGLLTAVVRPALPTAPVLAIDAPVQGSGKTLLASCIAALATGRQPEVWPHVAARDDEEVRKRLLAALRSGSGAIIWDNVIGALNSASLAAAITSPSLTDRVLGRSETVTVRNGAVIVLTGNNLTLAGDLPRRVLVMRIDPGVAIPSARMFCRDPLADVLSRRLELVAAALTLIRGRIGSDAARADGRTASFELWDDMVRQTVAWVGRVNRAGIPGGPDI